MLQLSYIRQNTDRVKERLAVKYFTETEVVDKIIQLDDEKRKLQLESENVQSRANAISKEIGQLFAKGQKDEAASKKQEAETLNASVKPIKEKLAELEQQLDENAFCRIHRSAIVKLDRVRRLEVNESGEYDVLLIDGTKLRLSRRYRNRLQFRMRIPGARMAKKGAE